MHVEIAAASIPNHGRLAARIGTMARVQPACGTLLRQWRIAACLTQEALAERASLSVRAISDLERGINRHPRPASVRRLADALSLSTEDRRVLLGSSNRLTETSSVQ